METEVKAPDVSQGAPKLDELEVTPLHRLLRRIVSLRKTVTPNNLACFIVNAKSLKPESRSYLVTLLGFNVLSFFLCLSVC